MDISQETSEFIRISKAFFRDKASSRFAMNNVLQEAAFSIAVNSVQDNRSWTTTAQSCWITGW